MALVKQAKASAKNKKTVVPVITRKAAIKYRLLHVPSGQHLKLGVKNYHSGESNSVYGYTQLWKTLAGFITQFGSLSLCRHEILCNADDYKSIELKAPNTDRVIFSYSFSSLTRIDQFDPNKCEFPRLDSYFAVDNKIAFEKFKLNPEFTFSCYIRSAKGRCDCCEDDEDDLTTYTHRVPDEALVSWDTALESLFRYLQECNYAVTLQQFSATNSPERILLMEFEIDKG